MAVAVTTGADAPTCSGAWYADLSTGRRLFHRRVYLGGMNLVVKMEMSPPRRRMGKDDAEGRGMKDE